MAENPHVPPPPEPERTDPSEACGAARARATYRFEDIFSLPDIQRIQDAFATAAGVAAIITDPEGRPLTRPSNFTTLCATIIRATPKGLAQCRLSDASLGRLPQDGPNVRPCQGCGLLDGGTAIRVGEHHVATWLIGQVLDAETDPESLLGYAMTIGADPDAFRKALAQVPRMSRQRFAAICQALHLVSSHLSGLAVRNFRQEQLIGALRKAQADLKDRDRNLAAIIDFLPDPTLVLDNSGAVIFWNRALEKLTGMSADAMLGKRDFQYGVAFYGEPTALLADYARGAVPRPDARYAVAEMGEDTIIAEVDLPILPGGPKRIWAKAVALRDEAGRITGAIESIRDVTERHRTATALRASEAMFRRIVETANEGVWVFDVEYRTSFVNRRMADMLGYTPEAMTGLPIEHFLPEDERVHFQNNKIRRRQGLADIFEQRLRTKSGDWIWTLTSASPLYDANGQFLGSLGMLTDITDRKRVEEELATQRQYLEAEVERRTWDLRQQAMELAEANIRMSELDRLKSLFLSTVSHELRTPLTSILGFAKLIGRDFDEHFLPLAGDKPHLVQRGRRIGSNLKVVFNEAERLTRLINDVLDLNRIESGNVQWHDRPVDLAVIARQTAQSLSGLLEQRPELTFTVEVEDGLPLVQADPDQLIQVLSNLLQNAVKFTPTGSVHLRVCREGNALLVAVRDTGIGIPVGQLESIFDKFHQVRHGDTVDDTSKGTGLGLAICRQIVRHYEGRIWAESQPGQGSVFYVRLPLPQQPCLP